MSIATRRYVDTQDALRQPLGSYPTLTGGKLSATVMPAQTAIADLNLGTLTLLTDAITAIGTIQSKVNTLLAELRTAGILAP